MTQRIEQSEKLCGTQKRKESKKENSAKLRVKNH